MFVLLKLTIAFMLLGFNVDNSMLAEHVLENSKQILQLRKDVHNLRKSLIFTIEAGMLNSNTIFDLSQALSKIEKQTEYDFDLNLNN